MIECRDLDEERKTYIMAQKEIDSKPGQRGKKKGRDRQAPMLR